MMTSSAAGTNGCWHFDTCKKRPLVRFHLHWRKWWRLKAYLSVNILGWAEMHIHNCINLNNRFARKVIDRSHAGTLKKSMELNFRIKYFTNNMDEVRWNHEWKINSAMSPHNRIHKQWRSFSESGFSRKTFEDEKSRFHFCHNTDLMPQLSTTQAVSKILDHPSKITNGTDRWNGECGYHSEPRSSGNRSKLIKRYM